MIRKKKKEGIIMKKQFAFLRRFTALMLALCMLTALTAEIFAADIVASGYCGGEDAGFQRDAYNPRHREDGGLW